MVTIIKFLGINKYFEIFEICDSNIQNLLSPTLTSNGTVYITSRGIWNYGTNRENVMLDDMISENAFWKHCPEFNFIAHANFL